MNTLELQELSQVVVLEIGIRQLSGNLARKEIRAA